MLILGLVLLVAVVLVVGFAITSAKFSQRHWRRLIAQGDRATLLAAVEEALVTFRGMRPPREMPPADWRALQSAALVAADRDCCRVSLMVEPDVRVLGSTERREVGTAESVARRVAVRMAERLLYEIPLVRFNAVQVDVYREYRSLDGPVETECLLTTRVDRSEGAVTDWDDLEPAAILATWQTYERALGRAVDPDVDAIIMPDEDDGASGGDDAPVKDGTS